MAVTVQCPFKEKGSTPDTGALWSGLQMSTRSREPVPASWLSLFAELSQQKGWRLKPPDVKHSHYNRENGADVHRGVHVYLLSISSLITYA